MDECNLLEGDVGTAGRMKGALISATFAVLLSGCVSTPNHPAIVPSSDKSESRIASAPAVVTVRSWPVMGTWAEAKISSNDTAGANLAIEAVRDVFDRIDRTMSIYRPQSDISRLNFAAGETFVAVDTWLVDLLRKSKLAHKITNGAFSIDVLAPGIALGIKPAFAMPPFEKPQSGRDQQIIIDASGAVRVPKNAGIDVGGIAKGYALDRAAEELTRRGFESFFLSLGRSVFAGTAPDESEGWTIIIEGEEETRTIADFSVSVSRQGLVTDTGHIVDPRTGESVRRLEWTAVAARRGWVADMASTALMVEPGLKQALKERYPSIEWVVLNSVPTE